MHEVEGHPQLVTIPPLELEDMEAGLEAIADLAERPDDFAELEVVEDDPDEMYEVGKVYTSKVRKIATIGYGYTEERGGHTRKRQVANDDNAFGLLAGVTCPGKTEFCNGCYAEESQVMPGVERKMRHNTEQLMNAESVEAMESMLTTMVQTYLDGAIKRGTPDNDLIFRVHWDGDFFSKDYAQAWANTMRKFSVIRFLAFTRSIGYGEDPVDVLPELSDVENLVLYLSLDEDNKAAGQAAYELWKPIYGKKRLLRAWCAEGYNFARALADEHEADDIPARICPENNRKLPLMIDKGDQKLRGACAVCRLCFNGTRDVLFASTGKDNVAIQNCFEFTESQPVALRPTRRKTPAESLPTPAQPRLFTSPQELATQHALFDQAV